MIYSRHNLLIVLLVTLLMTAGCAATGGKKYEEARIEPDKAGIYIYRPASKVGGNVIYPVYINGRKVMRLPQTAYYVYYAEPGAVTITARTPENEAVIELDAKAGEIYYVKGGATLGEKTGRATLTKVSPERGAVEIMECKYYRQHDLLREKE